MASGVAGIADQIKSVQVLGIPIGEAVLGGGSALILAEVTDALIAPRLPTMNIGFVKAGETYVMHRWGHKVLGGPGARVATLFLGYDTIRTIVPLEAWIKDVIAKLTGGIAPVPTPDAAAYSPAPTNVTLDAMAALDAAVAGGG